MRDYVLVEPAMLEAAVYLLRESGQDKHHKLLVHELSLRQNGRRTCEECDGRGFSEPQKPCQNCMMAGEVPTVRIPERKNRKAKTS